MTRETVCRWRNENPHFQAELNTRRKALWSAAHDKLRALMRKAVETLDHAVEDDDVRAAVEVLKAVQLYGNVSAPDGETDPELVLLKQAEPWANEEIRRQSPASL